jgi:hypothetical protein
LALLFGALLALLAFEARDKFEETDFPESGLFVFGIFSPPDSEGGARDLLLLSLCLFFPDSEGGGDLRSMFFFSDTLLMEI